MDNQISELVLKIALDKEAIEATVDGLGELTGAINECSEATRRLVELQELLNETLKVEED